MVKIITENFRVETTNEFVDSFNLVNADSVSNFNANLVAYDTAESLGLSNTQIEYITDLAETQIELVNPENVYYIMASSIDSNTSISNTQKEKREFLRRVIWGKRIDKDDIKYIFQNTEWQENTVYESFDDEKDVEKTNMYVTVLEGNLGEGPYRVFKCIRNNKDTSSVEKPKVDDDSDISIMPDGYEWKHMFDVPAAEYNEYGIANGLPYIANTEIINSAEENISDIIIEEAEPNEFSDYIVGLANTSTNSIEPVTVESISVDDSSANTYQVVIRTTQDARVTEGAYVGMYLRFIDPGQAETVYDIINTTTVSGNLNRLNVFVRSDIDLTSVSPSLVNSQCDISPKIEVSKSSGRRCIAYGILDSNGTLAYVEFVDRGSEYKYATAKLSLPEALQDTQTTVLRPVVSPTGGHGSNPISEMFMSRISAVTNFFSSDLTNVPGTNTYTKVGLVKNPQFQGGGTPVDFDNRLVVAANSDLTSTVSQNDYLTQETADETIVARIHDLSYDANTNETTLYLVDYEGAFNGTFEPGEGEIKDSLDAEDVETITINTVSTETYIPFTGDLLHFIDFDPIDRLPDRKEKIKFVFDF